MITCPVVCPATRCDAKNAICIATSSGSAILFNGVLLPTSAPTHRRREKTTHVAIAWYRTPSSRILSSAILVLTHPGATVFTRARGWTVRTISFFRDSWRPWVRADLEAA